MSLTIEEGGYSVHTTHTAVVGLARNGLSLKTTEDMAIALKGLLTEFFFIPEHDLEIIHDGKSIIVSCSCERVVDALNYAGVIEASAKANGYDIFNHLDERMEEY